MGGRLSIRFVVFLVAMALAATVIATSAIGCGGRAGRAKPSVVQLGAKKTATPRSGCACGDAVAQARVDAFALVAKRIYAQEHADVIGRSVVKHLGQNARLLRALRADDRTAIRAEARRAVITHEVRIRIARGSNVLMDAGLPFVVQAAEGELRDPNGKDLGRVQVSIQDVIGFVKLVMRETGTEVVVRGQRGREATLLPAAAHARLPAFGKAEVGGRSYLVRSFHEADFVGKPLTVWILDPV